MKELQELDKMWKSYNFYLLYMTLIQLKLRFVLYFLQWCAALLHLGG